MALKKRLITQPLAKSIDVGGSDPLIAAGHLQLSNMQHVRDGSIVKRTGLRGIDNGLLADDFIASHDQVPIVYGENIAKYAGSSPTVGSFDKYSDVVAPTDIAADPIYAVSGKQLFAPEVCEKGNVRAFAATRPDVASKYALEVRTFDLYSGKQLASLTGPAVSGVVNSRIIANDSAMHLFYQDASNVLQYRTINISTGAISGATALSGLNTIKPSVGGFDAVYLSDASETFMLAYIDNATNVVVASVKTSSGVTTAQTAIALNDPERVGIFLWQAGEACVLYAEDTGVVHEVHSAVYEVTAGSPNLRVTDVTLSSFSRDIQVFSLCGIMKTSATDADIYWTSRDLVSSNVRSEVFNCLYTDTGGGPPGTGSGGTVWTVGRHVYMVTKPVIDISGGRPVVGVYYDGGPLTAGPDGSQPLLCFVRFDETQAVGYRAIPIGKQLVGLAGYRDHVELSAHLATPQSVASTQWRFGSLEILLNEGAEYQVAGSVVDLTSIIDSTVGSVKTIDVNGSSLIAGLPLEFDGQRVVEHGFLNVPVILSATPTGPGSGWKGGAGKYGFFAVYEEYDSKNRRHISGVSALVEATMAASNDTVAIVVSTNALTRRSGIRIVVYGSDAANSTVYRRLASGTPLASLAADNNPAGDTVTISYDGSNITAQEKIYTSGGVLSNDRIDSFRVHGLWQGRHVYVPRHRESTEIRISKRIVDGEAIEHSGLQMIPVPAEGGAIIALAADGDKIYALKKRRIYMWQGRVADTRGLGSSVSESFLLSPTIGCVNQKSLLHIPPGWMFETESGIYLLTTDGGLSPVGRPVKYYTDNYTVAAAVAVPKKDHAVFLTTTYYALVYNYRARAWSTFTNYEAKDAVSADGSLYLIDDSGDRVLVEDSSIYWDLPAAAQVDYTVLLDLGHISPAGVGGFARVYRCLLLGYNITRHNLSVDVQIDNSPTWVSVKANYDTANIGKYFDYSDYYAGGLDATYVDKAMILSFGLPRQKITSFRLRIYDSAISPPEGLFTGETLSLVALGLEVGIKPGTRPIGSARRMT